MIHDESRSTADGSGSSVVGGGEVTLGLAGFELVRAVELGAGVARSEIGAATASGAACREQTRS